MVPTITSAGLPTLQSWKTLSEPELVREEKAGGAEREAGPRHEAVADALASSQPRHPVDHQIDRDPQQPDEAPVERILVGIDDPPALRSRAACRISADSTTVSIQSVTICVVCSSSSAQMIEP